MLAIEDHSLQNLDEFTVAAGVSESNECCGVVVAEAGRPDVARLDLHAWGEGTIEEELDFGFEASLVL